MKKQRHHNKTLKRDLLILGVSIIVTIFLLKIGAFNSLFTITEEVKILTNFVAGLMFTSGFTIAPASIVLAKLSESSSPALVALIGAFGACIGDLILFMFVKESLSNDVDELLRGSRYQRIRSILKLKSFRWLLPLMGAIVIASPLPDELGIAMMGFSRMRTAILLPISFLMNFLGILLIAHFAQVV